MFNFHFEMSCSGRVNQSDRRRLRAEFKSSCVQAFSNTYRCVGFRSQSVVSAAKDQQIGRGAAFARTNGLCDVSLRPLRRADIELDIGERTPLVVRTV
jgi:hypothetical protein